MGDARIRTGLFKSISTWKGTVTQSLKDYERLDTPGDDQLREASRACAEFLVAKDRESEILLHDIYKATTERLASAARWGLVDVKDAEEKSRVLLQKCEEHLGNLKRVFLPSVARTHNAAEAFTEQILEPESNELAFCELGDLQFALVVWRQNVKRNLALASTQDMKAEVSMQAHAAVEDLIKNCLNSANTFWNQHAGELLQPHEGVQVSYSPRSPARKQPMTDTPLGGESVIALYEKLSNKMALRLEAIAAKFGVEGDLSSFLRLETRQRRFSEDDTLSVEPETPTRHGGRRVETPFNT